MKLARVTPLYPEYVRMLYLRRRKLAQRSYAEQQSAIDQDAFGWADFWKHALEPLGYEVLEVAWNVAPLQRAWAREFEPSIRKSVPLQDITIHRLRQFRPEILWYEDPDASFLARIQAEVDSIQFVVGWAGSAIPPRERSGPVYDQCDLVLSCAPESVISLRNQGYRAKHIHHAFDPRILSKLSKKGEKHDLTFIGQLVLERGFHLHRRKILEILLSKLDVSVFAAPPPVTFSEQCSVAKREGILGKYVLKRSVLLIYTLMRHVRLNPKFIIGNWGAVRRIECWYLAEKKPIPSSALLRKLRNCIYGLDMYQVLANSKIALNIHADSSPDFASNMRMFEITGAGSCLLTEWKQNLHELFDLEKEVVTYKTVDECIEKALWLLANPELREQIALAGQKRTLRDHIFLKRGLEFDQILNTVRHKF